MNTKISCQELIDKYLSNTISKRELNQLLLIARENDGIEILTSVLKNKWKTAGQIDIDDKPYWDKKFTEILEAAGNNTSDNKTHPQKTQKSSYQAIFAGAMLLILVGYIYIFSPVEKKQAVKNTTSQVLKQQVLPGSNKAFLTLSNGTNIILDSANNGLLAKQGNMNIIKLSGGQLLYKSTNNQKSVQQIEYNTMRTPRGGQYQLTLPDSTQVWLNSASSIYFPTSFAGIDRKVEVTGEVYFEVTKNAAKPFTVSVSGMDVKVLGTHFNINAYNDDDVIKTTLLEGAVVVTKGKATVLLQPGNQARLNNYGEIKLLKNADVEEATAWKNGYFFFKNSSLQNVMRQLSRWYDVEVVYEGIIPERTFGGEISRNLSLLQILQILDKSKVHFNVAGKKIIVKSY